MSLKQINDLTPKQMSRLREFMSEELGLRMNTEQPFLVVSDGTKSGGVALTADDPSLRSDLKKLRRLAKWGRVHNDSKIASMAERTILARMQGTMLADRPL